MMVGRVLGESWRIYRQRFGIVLFFSFIFFGSGYTLYYTGVLSAMQTVGGVSMDYIGMAVRWAQGTPFEALFYPDPAFMSPGGMDLGAMPIAMVLMMGAAVFLLAYGILAVPMGMGGLTVLSTGEGSALGWRSVYRGLKQRYTKLLVTYLCYMVYFMAAGFAYMIVYLIVGVFAAIAIPLIIMGSGVGVAFGVVLILVSVLVIMAAYMVMMTLSVFVMPAAVFDRQYNFKAVGISIRTAWKHFFPVLGVQLVTLLLVGLATLLLFGVFFAIAWAAPDVPVYTPLWYGSLLTLTWPFSVIVNGVLYRHIQERDEANVQAA